jgi:hypothetical protein
VAEVVGDGIEVGAEDPVDKGVGPGLEVKEKIVETGEAMGLGEGDTVGDGVGGVVTSEPGISTRNHIISPTSLIS